MDKESAGDSGFTLIELLVVMIIIGVLAAIAIPAFLGQKRKAVETSAKSDVKGIAKEVIGFYTDGSGTLSMTEAGGTWTLSTSGRDVASGSFSKGNELGNVSITSDSDYCVAVQPTADGAAAWHVDQEGLTTGDCPV